MIRKPAFGKETVDVWIPFERSSKSMEHADKTWNKVLWFVQGEKKLFNDIGNSVEKAVKQSAVLEEKASEGLVNGEDKMPMGTLD